MEKEQLQKDIMQINLLDGKLQELEQQMALLEKQINELQVCGLALEDIKNIKPETEMLAAVSPGVFVKTKLKDNKEIFINTGAKIFCKKNTEDAKEFIQTKLNIALDVYNKLSSEVNSIVETMNSLEQELRAKVMQK